MYSYHNNIDGEFDIGIIGGGASGVFASIISKEKKNLSVAIFESEDRILKKVLKTGNGKCNLTNKDLCLSNFQGNPILLKTVLSKCSQGLTLDFFKNLGIRVVFDENGKCFPASYQASSVVDSLRFGALKRGVKIYTETEIVKIEKKDDKFLLRADNRYNFLCSKVIFSTGGLAGLKKKEENFFRVLKDLGITINKPFPALVQLRLLESEPFKSMKGCKWECGVILNIDGNNTLVENGEILFTNYGISGNAILNISREAVKNLNENKKVKILIDLLPEMTDVEIKDELTFRIKKFGDYDLEFLFNGWINKRIGVIFLKSLGFNMNDKINILKEKDVKKIIDNIHSFAFTVTNHNGFFNAQVMAGGVSVEELDFETLQHKRIKDLYFAGEIVDVDGKSGGYNLQWAWSSGYVSALSAVKSF